MLRIILCRSWMSCFSPHKRYISTVSKKKWIINSENNIEINRQAPWLCACNRVVLYSSATSFKAEINMYNSVGLCRLFLMQYHQILFHFDWKIRKGFHDSWWLFAEWIYDSELIPKYCPAQYCKHKFQIMKCAIQ